jgi:hypothetical protein
MGKLMVYRYAYTHPRLGQKTEANRMGTKEYVELVGGWIIEGSGIEIDASKVDDQGKTEIGFRG